MRNWSLENVSDGYGRNLVQVYVSILSITLVQQLGHSLGYGELLQLACWISLSLASASVSSLWSYFENELCWEGILVLRASSVFDSIDCYFKSLLLRQISWIWKHFVDDPSFTSSQAYCIFQYKGSSRIVMRLPVQADGWFIEWVYDWYQVRMISLLLYIRYVIMEWSNKNVTDNKIERFTMRLIGIY